MSKRRKVSQQEKCEGRHRAETSLKAFHELKDAISSQAIVLPNPDWGFDFEIHCDASTEEVGAILSQKINGVERVV